MAYSYVWYNPEIPKEVINIACQDIHKFDNQFQTSRLNKSDSDHEINKDVRNSFHAWIPSTYWLCSMVWNYVNIANKTNFLFDIEYFDYNSCQYTLYQPGCFYNWHQDSTIREAYQPQQVRGINDNISQDLLTISGESTRKLTFVMQLSDPHDYEGGDLQFLDIDRNLYTAPKEQGTIIVFDSRLSHRVTKIRSGRRRSLVGWAVGPRWK